MSSLARLDHAVINVHMAMDKAESCFQELGFTVTPRGYHSLGSINHLMIFGSDYLELIGLPADGSAARRELLDGPVGIDGLVFKTVDVDADFARLQQLQMAGDPPKAFSRPVDIDGAAAEARFRTVHCHKAAFPEGRVYFCEHGTPEFVWRPSWQSHANGVTAMCEIVLGAAAPQAVAERYGRLLAQTPVAIEDGFQVAFQDCQLQILNAAGLAARFAHMARPIGDAEVVFAALVMTTGKLDQARQIAEQAGSFAVNSTGANRFAAKTAEFDTVIEFVAD
jgi:hypothetical protein